MLNVERKHIFSSFKDIIMFWKIFIICQAPGPGHDLANLVTNLAEQSLGHPHRNEPGKKIMKQDRKSLDAVEGKTNKTGNN